MFACVLQAYHDPMLKLSIMTEQELNQIFGTLDSLIPLHEGRSEHTNFSPLKFMNSRINEIHSLFTSYRRGFYGDLNLKDFSPGHDNIDGKLLISIHEYSVKPLSCIFSLSLEKGIVPLELKISTIIPSYKDDDPAVFNNYLHFACYIKKT